MPRTGMKCSISCLHCRMKKIKCDSGTPCQNCVRLKIHCEKNFNDGRKKRYNWSYVEKLESNLGKIQAILLSGKENEAIVSCLRELFSDTMQSCCDDPKCSDHKILASASPKPSTAMSQFDASLLKSPLLLECIANFFKWEYPDINLFIHRELFLASYFDFDDRGEYCSEELIYSISALGAKLSSNEEIYHQHQSLYNTAKEKIFAKLNNPHITVLQSLLCLAFYDLGNGNYSSGWMLSGLAFRMSYDLSFEPNLEADDSVNHEISAIRSRIYWGCYVSDHFISFILGKPLFLKKPNSSVPKCDDLPELDGIDNFKFIDSDKYQPKMQFLLTAMVSLSDIGKQIMDSMFNHKLEQNNITREIADNVAILKSFDQELETWKSELPDGLNWSKDQLKDDASNPTKMSLRYYYYIIRICLNRPFISHASPETSLSKESPERICRSMIDDLYVSMNFFERENHIRLSSILIIYSAIISLSVFFIIYKSSVPSEIDRLKIDYFLDMLKRCSNTWQLANKSYNMAINKTKVLWGKSVRSLLNESENKGPILEQDSLGGPPFIMRNDSNNDIYDKFFQELINS